MRQRLVAAAAAVAALSSAWAISAHFISATGTVNDAGSLVVSFKEAGLGDTTLVDYLLSSTASATYVCFNRGNNQPQGAPYALAPQTLTAEGSFASGKNGSVVGTLTAGPPSPAPADAALKCTTTGNKQLCLMHVSYSGTTLTDTTFNVTTSVSPDPTERSFAAPTKANPSPSNCVTSL